MTIAMTPGVKTASAHAAGAAARSPAGGADAAPEGAAFLLALGACSAEADAGAAPGGEDGDQPVVLAVDAAQTPLVVVQPIQNEAPPVAVPGIDAAALLAQGAIAAMASPAVVPAPAGQESGTPAIDSVAPAGGAALPQAGPSGRAVATSVVQGAGESIAKGPVASQQGSEPTVLTPAADRAAPEKPMSPRAGAALSAAHASQQAASTAPSDARVPSHPAAAMAEPVMQLALAATGLSPRRAERADERGPSVFSPVHADNQTGAPAAGASPLMPAVDPASAGAGTGHAGLNERMVDQVSWWLSQRTQGAELQLDVAGGAPVSVSVQVQGNEAQVAFRSDHPEARQLLANALPQLEKMMGAEGLVLSGASVGSSGNGGQHGEAPPGEPARAGQGEKDALAAPAAPVRRPVSGRALDLYV